MCIPEVNKILEDNIIENVVICGVQSHICVQNTTLDLLNKGLNVHLIVDAISSRSMVDRMYAFERMRNSGAFLTTSEAMIYGLAGASDHPHFKELQQVVVDCAPDTGLLHPEY